MVCIELIIGPKKRIWRNNLPRTDSLLLVYGVIGAAAGAQRKKSE